MKNLNACALIIHLSSAFIIFFGLPNFLYYPLEQRPLVWSTHHSKASPELLPALGWGFFLLQNYMHECKPNQIHMYEQIRERRHLPQAHHHTILKHKCCYAVYCIKINGETEYSGALQS